MFSRKSRLFHLGFVLTLLLVSSIPMLAGATAPEDLHFDLDVIYHDVPTQYGSGSWSSDGLLAGSGEVAETFHDSGWNPERCWRTVHPTSVLTGPTPQDTITIRMQTIRVHAAPWCATFTAEGNWVVLSATGIYAGLHGQGQATISGHMEPGPGGTIDFLVHSDLQGQGHFD